MLDRFTESPLFAFGFIFFVFILGIVYLVNREKSQVQRLKGPRRFQPRWSGQTHDRRKRRRRSQGFKPGWSPRSPAESAENPDSPEPVNPPGEPDPDA